MEFYFIQYIYFHLKFEDKVLFEFLFFIIYTYFFVWDKEREHFFSN